MSMSVKISVIMPVYNTPEPQLKKALSSVLEQDMPDFELIICDDGSEPFVQKIIGMCSDPRIKYLRNKENKGCACSLNRCIQEAQGELLIRQDSDDYSLQGRFAALKAAYEQTGADIIASNIMLFDDSGISEYANNQGGGQYQPTKHTVFKSGEQREIRQTLRNADRKRIQYCTGKADMGSYVYHTQPGDGVISH